MSELTSNKLIFSVVIPTCDRITFLARCLEKLDFEIQGFDKENYEIIVTDDSPNDSTKDWLAENFAWVRWTKGPRRGPASNRNNGARLANGEWLVFIDDDCVPEPNVLLEFRSAIQNYPHSMAFEGAVHPDNWAKLSLDLSECPVNTTGGVFWSANVCIKRSVFWEINGFDELFTIAAQEDQDIYLRLKKVTNVPFVSRAKVIHPVRIRSLADKMKQIPKSLTNWMNFSLKHNSFTYMLIDAFRSQLAFLVHSIRKRKPKLIVYHIATIVMILPTVFFRRHLS